MHMHSKKGFSLIELMIVVAVIGILAAIAIPQYVKYIKRSRTSGAVDHARMICNAVTDWASSPDMSDGDLATYPPFPTSTAGKDGKTFLEHFPSEGAWLQNGDLYYTYTVNVVSNPNDPVVTATARGGAADPAVYAATVQSGGLSVIIPAPNNSLAGCKANVEVVSTAY